MMKRHSAWLAIVIALPLLAHFDLAFRGKNLFARGHYNSGQCGGLISERFDHPSAPAFVISDPESSAVFNEPVANQIAVRLHKGELPLWSTDAGPGAPLLTNNQAGAFFPLNWIAFLIPTSWGVDLSILARLLACFYFAYLAFRRGFGLGRLASLVGATVYGLTGNVLLKGNMGTPAIYAVFPLYLWAVRRLHTEELRWQAIAGVAVTTALILSAGFPEAALGAFYLSLALHLSLTPWRVAGRRHLGRILGAYAIGALLAGPSLLPLLQAMSLLPPGYRVGMGLHGVTPPAFFRNLLVPVVEHWPEAHQPGWLTWMPIVLAVAGMSAGLGVIERRRETWVLSALAGLYVLKSIQFPGIQQALLWLPFVSITHPSRDLSLWLFFPASLFAAQAIHLWQDLGAERKRFLALGIVVATSLLMVGLMVAYKESPAPSLALFLFHNRGTSLSLAIAAMVSFYFLVPSRREFFTLHFERVALAALLVASVVGAIPRGKPARDELSPAKPLRMMQQAPFARQPGHPRIAHVWPNARCTAEWGGTFGYGGWNSVDPLMPERQLWFMHAFFDCLDAGCLYGIRGAKTRDPLFPWRISAAEHLLDITGSVTPASFGPSGAALTEAWRDPAHGVVVYRDPGALPRAFTTSGCRIFPRFEDVYATLKAEERIPDIAYLDEAGGKRFALDDRVRAFCAATATSSATTATTRTPVTPLEHSNSRVRFELTSAKPELLVLADLLHPDWVAKIDGNPTPQYPTFGMYRSVLIPSAGKHEVTFELVPLPFYWGLAAFVAGLLALVALAWRFPGRD